MVLLCLSVYSKIHSDAFFEANIFCNLLLNILKLILCTSVVTCCWVLNFEIHHDAFPETHVFFFLIFLCHVSLGAWSTDLAALFPLCALFPASIVFFILVVIWFIYWVSQKKGTNRMLLEPRCTGSITSSWHPLCLENFWPFLTKTKQDQVFPSHVDGKIWPQSTQFG